MLMHTRSVRSMLVIAMGLLLGACGRTPTAQGAGTQNPRTTLKAQALTGTVLRRGTSYTRPIRLQHQGNTADNGRILMTFEDLAGDVFPIYESLNDGQTWSGAPVAEVADQVHAAGTGWALKWQPDLFELPQAVGDLPRGTLLLAGNAVHFDGNGTNDGQELQLYVSTDLGRTWTYRSSIISGSGEPFNSSNSSVWEPNLQLAANGSLVVYYSSEQHKAEGFNQLLAHKVSVDGGLTWGSETRDVAIGGGAARPGMAVVTRLPDGRYAMSYEDVGGPRDSQVYLKFSADGLNWGTASDRGTPVQTASGTYPSSTPVVTWLPVGGPRGLLVASGQRVNEGTSGERKLYWNDNLGQGPWWEMTAPVQFAEGNDHAGWSQGMLLTADGAGLFHSPSSATNGDINQNEIRYGSARLFPHRYQAENAALTRVSAVTEESASNGAKVGYIDYADSSLTFTVNVAAAGTYPLTIRYANGWGASSHQVSINGRAPTTVNYANNGVNVWTSVVQRLPLQAGNNTIRFSKGANFTELDYIELPTRLNDTLTGSGRDQFEYSAGWNVGGGCSDCSSGNDHYANSAGTTATLRFNGTRVRLYGAKGPDHGLVAVSIDGGSETLVDLYAASRQTQQNTYTSPLLSAGPHTLRARVTGSRNTSANNTYVTVDAADVSH